jgi:hypothetical protein
VATYGEKLLAQAEARTSVRTARRRRVTLLFPTVAAILWSCSDLVAARHGRLVTDGAGFFRLSIGVVVPAIWMMTFVLLPAVAALKRDPLPAGAALAFIAGPVLTPMLFGAGGWKWWQITVVGLMTVLVLGAAMGRARTIVLD